MNLFECMAQREIRPPASVPDWMLGHFRRRSITFADGRSDCSTHVHWFQCRGFTIDLRLPNAPPLPPSPLEDRFAEELRTLANHEGWMADSHWQDDMLSWQGGVSLQLHNRWPEPARLQRVGNCLVEFAPSGAYVEDWRLQPGGGALIGLRLLEERDEDSNELLHQGGGLIVCGGDAALVRGRAREVAQLSSTSLRDAVFAAQGDPARLQALLNFETSVASGDARSGYRIERSTVPERVGQSLLHLEGFDWQGPRKLLQTVVEGERRVRRLFDVDTLQAGWEATMQTPITPAATAWFDREFETLGRHLEWLG